MANAVRLRVEIDILAKRMARNLRLVDNSFALHDVLKQTVGGLYRGTLSCKDIKTMSAHYQNLRKSVSIG
jgi:hypothetical protein